MEERMQVGGGADGKWEEGLVEEEGGETKIRM